MSDGDLDDRRHGERRQGDRRGAPPAGVVRSGEDQADAIAHAQDPDDDAPVDGDPNDTD
jgi:hypothetical protein